MTKTTVTKETQIKAINWILKLRATMKNLVGTKKNYRENAYLHPHNDLILEKTLEDLKCHN